MAWSDLEGILESAQAELLDEKSRPPVACPNDATALATGPDGELFCPFDGWKANGHSQWSAFL